ncbi:hypothetical protein, partial [Herbaspirillum sp.]|uniref:hypothetical protein n=1 Tax=Herbaspirillum sp. TaxID=1890675 RepID=UPI002583A6EA
MPRSKKKLKEVQLSIFDAVAKSSVARDQVKFMLDFKNVNEKKNWRGLIAIPPGTLLEDVINQFQ